LRSPVLAGTSCFALKHEFEFASNRRVNDFPGEANVGFESPSAVWTFQAVVRVGGCFSFRGVRRSHVETF